MGQLFMNADNSGVEIYEEKYDYTAKKYYFKYRFYTWKGKLFELPREKDLNVCRKKRDGWLNKNE